MHVFYCPIAKYHKCSSLNQHKLLSVSVGQRFGHRLDGSFVQGHGVMIVLSGTAVLSDAQGPLPTSFRLLEKSVLCSYRTHGSFHLLDPVGDCLCYFHPWPALSLTRRTRFKGIIWLGKAHPDNLPFMLLKLNRSVTLIMKFYMACKVAVEGMIFHPTHRFCLLSRESYKGKGNRSHLNVTFHT